VLREAAGVARYLEEALPRLRALSRQHQTFFPNPTKTHHTLFQVVPLPLRCDEIRFTSRGFYVQRADSGSLPLPRGAILLWCHALFGVCVVFVWLFGQLSL